MTTMGRKIRLIGIVALVTAIAVACGSGAVDSLANVATTTTTAATTNPSRVASSTARAPSTATASSTATTSSATTVTTAAPPTTTTEPATDEAAADGGAPAGDAETDAEVAVGWVDVSARSYAPCDVVDVETYVVEVFNGGDDVADYELSVVFFAEDGSEHEAAATARLIPSLRPRERAVDRGWSQFDGVVDACIVTTIRRATTSGDGPEPEDRCMVLGVDESGFVDFRVEVIGTHDGPVRPMVAFSDAEGVRRATHQGLIEGLPTGVIGTVADVNISAVADPSVVSCVVVSRSNS